MCASVLSFSCAGHGEGMPDAGGDPTMSCGEGLRPVAARRSLPLRLDFEDVALDCTGGSLGRWSLRSDGAWFNVPLKGDPPPSALARVPGVGSGSALSFHLGPVEPRPGAMEKVMVELYGRLGGGGAAMIPFGEERLISFRIRLPSSFEPPGPTDMLIVWQLWQGSPYGPPLRMEIDSQTRPVFLLLNDKTGSHPCAADLHCSPPPPYAGVIELYRGAPLLRDEWHRVTISVLPRHVGMGDDGRVRIWIDQPELEAPAYAGSAPLGYDPRGFASYPDAEPRGFPHPNDSLEVSLGLYRSTQVADQVITFDELCLRPSVADGCTDRTLP